MFSSIGAFSAFFFPAVILVIVGIFFEEELIAFESKLFKRISGAFTSSKKNNKKTVVKVQNKNTKKIVSSNSAYRSKSMTRKKNANNAA